MGATRDGLTRVARRRPRLGGRGGCCGRWVHVRGGTARRVTDAAERGHAAVGRATVGGGVGHRRDGLVGLRKFDSERRLLHGFTAEELRSMSATGCRDNVIGAARRARWLEEGCPMWCG
ncbi:uncharacterized protein M6B38_411860 [Iris pallida]|uniref:Uncharacterized protein n=1 Tax=Iris pallida TaxID=29817 RepID=A0AAX6FLL0_IRIPA|nr:uncharacterized protein M6B38_411860 [Iris pallida]